MTAVFLELVPEELEALVEARRVLAVPTESGTIYPAGQFPGGRLVPGLESVLGPLLDVMDPFSIAFMLNRWTGKVGTTETYWEAIAREGAAALAGWAAATAEHYAAP